MQEGQEQPNIAGLARGEMVAAPALKLRDKALDGPVHYQPVEARTILNRVQAMMPMRWTINPYRGCRHACVYCFARPTHTYYGLNAGLDFQSRIFVKINAPQLLRKELARRSWKGETICLGSATDPYQPAERRYRLSRQLLEVLCEAANPLEIITKSHMVGDDLDLLIELNRRTDGRVAVNMSLTTLDEGKARLIDPGAPNPARRMEAIARMSAAGIKTRLFIMPVLPGITDQPDELERLVEQAAQMGVQYVAADPLRIARGLEEYFYQFLDSHFPELRPRYERIYAGGRRTTIDDRYRQALREKMVELRLRYGIAEREQRGPELSAEQPIQGTIFDEPVRLQARLETANNRGKVSPVATTRPTKAPPQTAQPSLW